MKKGTYKKAVALIALLFFVSLSFLPTITSSSEERTDHLDITIEQLNKTTINICAEIPEFSFSCIGINGEEFTMIDLENSGRTYVEGQAKLPMIRKMIEIPQGSVPVISMSSENWEVVTLDELDMPYRIVPIQPSVEKSENGTADLIIDMNYYTSDQYFPIETVRINEINEIRGRRFALVEIAPVQYNPVNGELLLLVSCDITIDLSIGFDWERTLEQIERCSSNSFEELFETIFSNYGYYEGFTVSSKTTEGFLMIVYDTFSEEIAPLVSWKSSLGYDVIVTVTSEIPGGVTTSNIKAYIQDAYDTWAIPPAYILLVGDTGQIPAFSSGGGASDTLYAKMDGDSFPDIYIGRFPASTETQVTTMVDKTLYYEQGVFDTYDWIKKAAFLASVDNYQISEGTHNYVIDTHLEPNGYLCDRLYQVTYGANTQDVRDSINDGRSLVIYSGHGSQTSWGDGPPFSQSDVNGLTNDGMYPFVCSHACLTGQFSVAECFGETWLRAQNKGAIAFWGSSINTYWDTDDIIEKRMFDAWWYDNLERIGQMTNKGMYDSYMEYGSGMTQFINSYNVLGDTSIKIWRDAAGNFDAYQSTFDRGFPVRHAVDGDWAAGQSFTPNFDTISGVDIYLRKFGTPEFNLTIELREENPEGLLLDTIIYNPLDIDASWKWVSVDFEDIAVVGGMEYCIVLPPAPSGVTTSYGYEWGYAFGDQYDRGTFWFTRNGGSIWRDLPTMYDFTFRTY